MGGTKKAWERMSYIRWPQAGLATGAREEHKTRGLGGNDSARGVEWGLW